MRLIDYTIVVTKSISCEQAMARVDEIGGWPAWADELKLLNNGDVDTICRFSADGWSNDRVKHFYDPESWATILTRDQYYIARLSFDALRKLRAELNKEV
jgi:hypothetical protein